MWVASSEDHACSPTPLLQSPVALLGLSRATGPELQPVRMSGWFLSNGSFPSPRRPPGHPSELLENETPGVALPGFLIG